MADASYNYKSMFDINRGMPSVNERVNPETFQVGKTQTQNNLIGQGGAVGAFGAGQPNLGLGDITKAQEGAELLKKRYVDENPYEKYLAGARTGTMAMLGRQSEIDRTQLEAGLGRMGQGVNALRRTGARANLNTELAYRYMGAEKGLAELGIASAERAQGALNDYIGAYLNIAGRQQGAYQSYWQRYSQGASKISAGGRSTADRKGGESVEDRQQRTGTSGYGGRPAELIGDDAPRASQLPRGTPIR